MYFDSTFCTPNSFFIPSPKLCLDTTILFIESWFSPNQKTNKIVHVENKTRYGYEFLMQALSSRFKTEIHVTESMFDQYKFSPAVQSVMATNPSAKIHFCKRACVLSNNSGALPRHQILTLVPTVMFFTVSCNDPSELVKVIEPHKVRVCYSSHSSLEEVCDFLACLKFDSVTPCVKPNSELSLQDVTKLIYDRTGSRPVTSAITLPLQNSSESLWNKKIPFNFEKTSKRKLSNDENCLPETHNLKEGRSTPSEDSSESLWNKEFLFKFKAKRLNGSCQTTKTVCQKHTI